MILTLLWTDYALIHIPWLLAVHSVTCSRAIASEALPTDTSVTLGCVGANCILVASISELLVALTLLPTIKSISYIVLSTLAGIEVIAIINASRMYVAFNTVSPLAFGDRSTLEAGSAVSVIA